MMQAAVVFEPPYPEDRLALVPERNLITGRPELTGQLGGLTSLEEDLLVTAAALFAVDLAAKRGERERLTRDITVTVPVVNYHALRSQRERLENLLYLLSDDNWEVEFVRRDGPTEPAMDWPTNLGKTLLFSGGLDSLAGAVDLLTIGTNLQLASHYTQNAAIQGSQKRLYEYLQDCFGEQVRRVKCRITGRAAQGLPFPDDRDREPTQRTRSLMFVTIAAISARRAGFHELVLIAENGQMAIHLPLTAARIGAFSTHTAHPEVVYEMERYFSDALSFDFQIRNPYLYKTKAEVIERVISDHSSAVPLSVSCWKSSRQALNHCGECIPCLVRRIAVERYGVKLAEYTRDLLVENIGALGPEDTGKRNLIELCEFITWFGADFSDARIMDTFPELINPHLDSVEAISMYRRFAAEAGGVLASYPNVSALLG